MRKTTKAQFERFKKWCLKLQGLIGLTDYRIDIYYQDQPDAYATSRTWYGLALAEITFSKKVPKSSIVIPPEENASHEMAHVLLGQLQHMACSRFIHEEEIDNEVERVARILTPIIHLYGQMGTKK